MFFQLEVIDRLSKANTELEQAKNKLHNLVIDCYQSQSTVKASLTSTIAQILQAALTRSQMFSRIEEDAMQGFLVPSFIDFDQFVMDKKELPEWTRVVFEKEFEKQKQSLDIMAKKLYSTHSLTEAKDKHSRQLNSFKVLSDRYHSLSEHDQTVDIMSEADRLKNLTQLTSQKYTAYLQSIASKLTSFVEQMSAKCMIFSNELNAVASKSTSSLVYQQKAPQTYGQYDHHLKTYSASLTKGTEENWLTRANRTLQQRSQKNPQQYLLRQPKWLNTYISDYYI